MRTSIVAADDPRALQQAIALLQAGEVVAFPTDTVYGVGAPATDAAAVARLYTVKGRPEDRAIPVLIAAVADLPRVTRGVPAVVEHLAGRFWPGGLTLVLPADPSLPAALTAGGTTVAVRCPAHPTPLALIHALGAPLAATSANLSGQPAPTTAAEVARQLAGRLPLILDGGVCPVGVPSTLVDLTTDPPRLLRAGAIPAEALRALLPDLAA
jgi:L-threonylcarbamoyladenylate synthase